MSESLGLLWVQVWSGSSMACRFCGGLFVSLGFGCTHKLKFVCIFFGVFYMAEGLREELAWFF
jgi:hypothetical protein